MTVMEQTAVAAMQGSVSGTAYVDGEYVPVSQAKVSVFDFGFARADSTYDVVHVWDGAFFRLDHHVNRFRRSLNKLRIDLPITDDELKVILHNCVAKAGLKSAFVAMICTRGRPPLGIRDLRHCKPVFIAYAVPFIWIFGQKRNLDGVSAVVPSVRRISPESVDQTVKNFVWLDIDRGLLEAYDRGAETVVLLDQQGHVTEGAGFNVFAVRNRKLVTPDHGMLLGITRQTVLEIAGELEFDVEVRKMTHQELVSADEIFISTTAGGISPIVKIDDRVLNDGRAGPVTTLIHDTYWAWHDRPSERTPVNDGSAGGG